MNKIEREANIILEKANDNVKGYAPLNLDECQNITITSQEYEIDEVLGDIIMAEYIDENKKGEVNRGGIWIKEDLGTRVWRTARVIKCGPQVSDQIKPGSIIQFPSDKGIKQIHNGQKYIFLNAERIFCTVKVAKTSK